ncbi:TonB-dependent receptor [Maribacter algicola]|uniref:TonB-dependent receptor n=1 Tax=Meishania litoralis TaxID=3434685 RepID=A0ACC7LFH1_9FLAO
MKNLLKRKKGQTSLFKFDLKMKLSVLLLLTSLFALHASESYSQQTKVTLNLNNITVEQLIDEIENRTEFRFLYLLEDVDLKRIVSVKARREKVNSILDRVFMGTNTTYHIDDRQISLIKNVWPEEKVKKRTQQSIQGQVKDENGQPLPGASIIEKGTANGTTTDFDGNFSLTVTDENASLIISYLGFLTQEIPINGQTNISAILQEDTAKLDEVVVVGYGAQSRKKVTGAIASVKSDQMADLPVTSFDQALAGQVTGVQVSAGTGSPGVSSDIKVRGVGTITAGTSPLLVIDGFPTESVNLSDINPNDIESVQVLKDAASAAIYGSRGSNGVILVSTKQGKQGKTQFSFNSYVGFQQVAETYDLANAYQWAEFQTENFRSQGVFAPDYVPDLYQPYLAGTPGLIDTDWQDEIYRTAPIRSYQFSARGGNEDTKFSVSGEYFDQDGIIISTDFKRYSFRTNLESNIFKNPENAFLKNIKLGVNVAPSYSTSNKVSENHHGDDGIVIITQFAYPNFAPYNPDGSFAISEQIIFGQSPTGLQNNGARFENTVAMAILTERIQRRFNVIGSTYLDFTLTDNLNFKTYFGLNYSDSEFSIFRPSSIGTRRNRASVAAVGRLDEGDIFNYITENTFNFKKTLGNDHNVDVLAGYSFQKERLFSSFLTSTNASANDFSTFNGSNTITGGDTLEEEWSLISYISRLNYDYKGKYLLSASFRRDGSSRFGDNSKWGNFPSISLGWRMSEEDFLQGNETISDLKLRASWGITGNNLIPNYGGTALLGAANYENLGGLSAITSPNANLSWEETKQIDLGIDFGLFNNKVSIIADYYKSTTDGLLLNVPVPSQSGFTSSLQNLGEVENKGFEFAISANNIKLGGVEWSSTFNISTNKNKVLSLGTDQTQIISKHHKTEVGRPLAEFYGWNIIGVYNTQEEIDASAHVTSGRGTAPGDYQIEDVNGDGQINDDDRKVIGDPNPDFTYGFSTTFKYKGWDLTALLQGTVGHDIVNFNYFFATLEGGFGNALAERVEGRWQSPSNPGTGWARAGNNGAFYDRSSKILQDGSFLRFRNIALGYTLDSKVSEKIGIDKARIFFSSINPFTFTNYTGSNPEVNSNVGGNANPLTPGLDWGGYPTAKSFTIGLNLTF